MGTTPLIDRIEARRKTRIGPVCPRPIADKMSPFSKRLAEKRLPTKDFWLGAYIPDGDGGAA